MTWNSISFDYSTIRSQMELSSVFAWLTSCRVWTQRCDQDLVSMLSLVLMERVRAAITTVDKSDTDILVTYCSVII